MTTQQERPVARGAEPGFGLETEYVPCNLCSSTGYAEVLRPNTSPSDWSPQAFACTSPHLGLHGSIVRCDSCGLVYTNPRPTPGQIARLYSSVEDTVYLREEEARVATFTLAVRGLKEYAPGGTLLDVGAHIGTFLAVARRHGYRVMGVEPSEWAAEVARSRGLEVYPCGLEEAGLPPESVDVVTVWDVIEHFTDPMGELRRVRRVLRPGGVVALTTMDVGSPAARLLGGRWPWYMMMHLYYFTPRTMRLMLEKAGFEVLGVGRHVRVVHARYLVSKLEAYSPPLARLARAATERLGLGGLRVPVTLGDLMVVYARKRPTTGA